MGAQRNQGGRDAGRAGAAGALGGVGPFRGQRVCHGGLGAADSAAVAAPADHRIHAGPVDPWPWVGCGRGDDLCRSPDQPLWFAPLRADLWRLVRADPALDRAGPDPVGAGPGSGSLWRLSRLYGCGDECQFGGGGTADGARHHVGVAWVLELGRLCRRGLGRGGGGPLWRHGAGAGRGGPVGGGHRTGVTGHDDRGPCRGRHFNRTRRQDCAVSTNARPVSAGRHGAGGDGARRGGARLGGVVPVARTGGGVASGGPGLCLLCRGDGGHAVSGRQPAQPAGGGAHAAPVGGDCRGRPVGRGGGSGACGGHRGLCAMWAGSGQYRADPVFGGG